MSGLIAGTGSAQGHGFGVERHAGMPRRPQSYSKNKQQIRAVSYRKRSIETQTAVMIGGKRQLEWNIRDRNGYLLPPRLP